MVVEDGTGLENADSYITVLEADNYIGSDTRWTSLSNDEKEKAIIDATRYIDAQYGPVFTGTRKKIISQALEWPRVNAFEGYYAIDPSEIPRRLKNSVAQLALYAVGRDLMPAIDEIVTEVTIGQISQKIIPGARRYPLVKKMLAPLLEVSSVRIGR